MLKSSGRNQKFVSLLLPLLLLLAASCAGLLSGCSSTEHSGNLDKLAGSWNCHETPLEDKNRYSGYLSMEIEDTGNFTMYDAEAGNPGIQGHIESLSEDSMVLNCTDDEDFDPPTGWDKMNRKQEIHYHWDGDSLCLTYGTGDDAITLVWDREADLQ